MVLCAFVGCNDAPKPTTPNQTPSTPTTPDNNPDEPAIEYTEMYYDDRVPLKELVGYTSANVEIKDQVVTSKVIGTDDPDSDVIKYDSKNDRIIAVGTGTAVLVVGETEYNVRVSAAPITLAIITGHSQGYGSQGTKNQTVVCEPGQAYCTHLLLSSEKWGLDWRDAFVGSSLGYTEEDRVRGIDIMTSDNKGATGENKGVGSALAYEWHRLTGEKMWVINCAVGGSSINQWQPGTDFMNYALEAINKASNILKNEVAAGHYEYRSTEMFNFSSANLSYNKVDYDDEKLVEWNDAMWKGFVDGCTVDIDGDGEADKPESMGYVVGWFPVRKNFSGEDAALIYFRTALKRYSHIYLASDLIRLFATDAGVAKNYPKTEYKTQNGGKQTICTTMKQVWAYEEKDPPTHLSQMGYNAVGLDMAKNLYNRTYGKTEIAELIVYESTANDTVLVGDEISMAGRETKQFVFVSQPNSVNNLTIEVSKNLRLDAWGRIMAVATGKGTITIKQGDTVIRTITVNVQ
jgi:hypothetical protein